MAFSFGTFSGGGLGMGMAFRLKDEFSGAASRVQGSMAALDASATRMQASINRSLQGVFSGAAIAGIGALMVAPFVKGLRESTDFHRQISATLAVARVDDAELKSRIEQQALNIGRSTAFTATQAAEAQEKLAMAGFTAEKILASAVQTVRLASAGSMGVSEAADIMSNVMTAMGLAAEESQRAADVLSLTAVSTNTNVIQMGEAMSYSAGQAHSMGASIEELSAITGLLGNIGLQGSIAGTSVSNFIRQMGKIGKKTDTLAKLGLTVQDFKVLKEGKIVWKDIGDILHIIATAGDKLTDKTGSVISDLLGVRGQRVLAAYISGLKEGQTSFSDLLGDLQGAAGSAERIALQKLDNLWGDLKKLTSAWQGMFISMGGAIEQAVRGPIQMLTVSIAALADFFGTSLGQGVAIATVSLGVLFVVMGGGLMLVSGFKWLIMSMAGAFGVLNKQIILTTFAMEGFWKGLVKMAAIAIVPLLPFLAWAVGIAAAFTAVFFAIRRSQSAFDEWTQGDAVTEWTRMGLAMEAFKRAFATADPGERSFVYSVEFVKKARDMGELETLGWWGKLGLRVATFWDALKTGYYDVVEPIMIQMQIAWDRLVEGVGKLSERLGFDHSTLETWKWFGRILGWVAGIVAGTVIAPFVGLLVVLEAISLAIEGIVIALKWVYKGVSFITDLGATGLIGAGLEEKLFGAPEGFGHIYAGRRVEQFMSDEPIVTSSAPRMTLPQSLTKLTAEEQEAVTQVNLILDGKVIERVVTGRQKRRMAVSNGGIE